MSTLGSTEALRHCTSASAIGKSARDTIEHEYFTLAEQKGVTVSKRGCIGLRSVKHWGALFGIKGVFIMY